MQPSLPSHIHGVIHPAQTADTFLVTPATIASWVKRIDERGPDALLQLREPVNKFPDFVRYIVHRLKTLSPGMGKVKIAETLCRAGLHLGTTTVGRILKEAPQPDPGDPAPSAGVVTAKCPNPQPCLAYRPDCRSDIVGLLGTVVAVRITPIKHSPAICGKMSFMFAFLK